MEIVAGSILECSYVMLDYARRVESLGFDTLHIPEMVHDPFVVSSLALAATSSLHVRTGVALALLEAPWFRLFLLGILHSYLRVALTGFRYSRSKNVEERYGMPFDKPVNRLSEYIGAVRHALILLERSVFLSGRVL